MLSYIDLEFTDFQEQIIHAIRDHTNLYQQHNISYILDDYLTLQNQKASTSKIRIIEDTVHDLEDTWSKHIKELTNNLDKYKKTFIELAKYREILRVLKEKKTQDDHQDTTRKRKRDEEKRAAADKKKRDDCREWLVNHPEKKTCLPHLPQMPLQATAPLPQMPLQMSQENMQFIMQFMAQFVPQQMVPSSRTSVEDSKDIKHQPTRILGQNPTSPWQNTTSSQIRPSSVQSMASTNNDVSAFALSRSSSRNSNLNESVIDMASDLRDMDIQENS